MMNKLLKAAKLHEQLKVNRLLAAAKLLARLKLSERKIAVQRQYMRANPNYSQYEMHNIYVDINPMNDRELDVYVLMTVPRWAHMWGRL
jgi:hypothetical protein